MNADSTSATPRRLLSRLLRTTVLLAGLLGTSLVPARCGIPEPDLVWYGSVLITSGGTTARATTGTLTWRIEPLAGGTPLELSTSLTNLLDQFSFVLRVPCESPELNVPASPGRVILGGTPRSYRRLTVLLDGQPLRLAAAASEFTPTSADRGRLERIDLLLGTAPADSDHDGLADNWEQQHFGTLAAGPLEDPDADGVDNLHEYRAGTDPRDAQSRFELLEVRRLPFSTLVRWSSQPGHRYRVLRSTSILDGLADFRLVESGIPATAPINEFNDRTLPSGATQFYRIQLDD